MIPFDIEDPVLSVVRGNNAFLIAAVARLHIDLSRDDVLDMTYGRGAFWTKVRPIYLIEHDIGLDGVDFRDLPEADESIDVVVFDPPYIAGGTPEKSTIRAFNERYGVMSAAHAPQSIPELKELFADGIAEAARVLRPRGKLLLKCMDFVDGGKFHTMRHYVTEAAIRNGFTQIDEFIHATGTGPRSRKGRQVTSFRAHSFLCVYRKVRSKQKGTV